MIVVDVSPAMGSTVGSNGHSHLSSARTVLDMFLKTKMLHRKKDVVGIIEVGRGRGGLSEIQSEIGAPSLELLRSVPSIVPSTTEGDVLDGIGAALGMIDAFCGKRKWQKRVMVITNGLSGMDSSRVSSLVMEFQGVGASLSLIGIGFDEFDQEEMDAPGFEEAQAGRTDKDPRLLVNEAEFRDLCACIDATVVNLKTALASMSSFRSKSVEQRPWYTGTLDIGSVAIAVHGYTKTSEVRLPSATKVSIPAREVGGEDVTGKVLRQLSYHRKDDDRTELSKEDICKGFRYGKSIVPFSAIDEDALKYKAPKALKALGFTSAKHIERHHYMKNITCFAPMPNSPESATALHALIHALYETDNVIIVRYVGRNNQKPCLGVCWPSVDDEGLCLYYSDLPFMEDVRHYPFAPLATTEDTIPSKNQLDAAAALIDALDLMNAQVDEDGEPCEALDPELTFNPVLQYFYQVLQHRAIHPEDTALPPINPAITAMITPDPNLFAQAQPALKAFADALPLVKVQNTLKRRRFYAEAEGNSGGTNDDFLAGPSAAVPNGASSSSSSSSSSTAASGLLGEGPLSKRQKLGPNQDVSVDSLSAKQTSKITTVDPVADFEAMCGRRDVDLVDQAIAEMTSVILNLVDNSFRDSYFDKALKCVIALRAMCISQEEIAPFNTFLPDLKTRYQSSATKAPFWKMLVDAGITLISSSESPDSSVSPAEAAAFISEQEAPAEAAPPPPAPAEDDDDDLFGMLE